MTTEREQIIDAAFDVFDLDGRRDSDQELANDMADRVLEDRWEQTKLTGRAALQIRRAIFKIPYAHTPLVGGSLSSADVSVGDLVVFLNGLADVLRSAGKRAREIKDTYRDLKRDVETFRRVLHGDREV